MEKFLAEILDNQKKIIALLQPSTKNTIDRITEDGVKYLGKDLSNGTKNYLEREVIVYAVREHTNTPMRYLTEVWGYSNESNIYRMYENARDKYLAGDKEFCEIYENMLRNIKIF
jgi:hypothetical protein